MDFPIYQTKNSNLDAYCVAEGEVINYGQIVAIASSGEAYTVSTHPGGLEPGGVIRTGHKGCVYQEGENVDVQTSGIAIVKVGGAALTAGDAVSSDATGLAVAHVPGTNVFIGVANSSKAAGEYLDVNLTAKH